MKTSFALVLLMTAAFTACSTAPRGKLLWFDEFNQTAGTAPSSKHWVYDIGHGPGGWGNNEWQYYSDDLANASIVDDPEATDGKALALTARKSADGKFTSARVKTFGVHSILFGRIEARVKVPKGQGLWPAVWMLGENLDDVKWPQCGEIDILEVLGHDPKKLYGTLHGPGYSGTDPRGGWHTLEQGSFADAYHVVAVEWEPTRIRWFVDGLQYHQVEPKDVPAGQWVFDKGPHYLILNLAVGGNWPGYPDETTTFPQSFLIDYVRVYARP